MADHPVDVGSERTGAAGPRVWGCIVCYQATAVAVSALVAALESQVERLLVLDNSPAFPGGLAAVGSSKTTYVAMPGNRGTAGAMNEAWRQALAAGVDAVISFDQDSQPGPDLVRELAASLARLSDSGERVAAIGPRKVDPRTGRSLRLLRPVRCFKRYASADRTEPVEVDHLITSGCLITAEAFGQVGPYDETLFLDYVDIEWCLRARHKGYALVCDPRLTMPHVIGETVVRIARWSVWLHQPKRNGLLVRNHLLLWRVRTMSRCWLIGDLRQVAVKILVHLAVARFRLQRLGWIARGFSDGIRGRGGPF